MRFGFWRRLAAALVLVLGVGTAGPAAQASAAPKAIGTSTHSAGVSMQDDWWW
jgi:hypothetical protein